MESVYEFLETNYGVTPDHAYQAQIAQWMDWWRGLHRPFHLYAVPEGNGALVQREMFTLKMAKKCCEDWASMLLNEQTTVQVEDTKAETFLQGEKGVLVQTDFWRRANALVELAFASGTGAARLRFASTPDQSEPVFELDFLHAPNIFPISAQGDRITEVAFLSQGLQGGKQTFYLEVHLLEQGEYVVHNHFFSTDKHKLTEQPLPKGVLAQWHTGSKVPLFAILRPNLVNHVSDSTPMGVSVFANALDNLKGIDLAYHNFCRDFKLGGKKVFISKSLTQTTAAGVRLTPDDVSQQLFTLLGDADFDDTKPLIQEFNPSLRVEDNLAGLQGMLDAFSMKVGFGTKMYQFRRENLSTATEYMGTRQELIQHRAKHQAAVDSFLHSLFATILWYAGEMGCIPKKDNRKITIISPDGLFWPAKQEE